MKKTTVVFLIICCCIPFAGIRIWHFLIDRHNTALIKEGNELVEKVEEYKKVHHKLPEYEEDMQLNLPDDYPLNYAKWDSTTYVVGFGIALGESIAYRSDTKKWDTIR